MNFTVERPAAFYALLLLIPFLIFDFKRFSKLLTSFVTENDYNLSQSLFARFKRCFYLRTLARVLAYVMLVLAYAGISWGTAAVPAQKSGCSVSFVFDISHSMEALDAPGHMSRLEAAANYADELLNKMTGASVSVVLAKGEATVAVPSTEDFEAVRSMLVSLSPKLMTSKGSSLGSGIRTALNSFPSQTSQAAFIWLFTDGEETDTSLSSALLEAVKYGVPVAIIGFGSEREIPVLAGDGQTSVNTALRTEAIQKTLAYVQKHSPRKDSDATTFLVSYVDASEVGSAFKLLNSIKPVAKIGQTSLVYEIQAIPRTTFFLTLAIIFFALSFILGELTIKVKKASAASLLMIFMLTSCSGKFSDGAKLLEGKLDWNRKDYQGAIADFLSVAQSAEERQDSETQQYALFNLASTYLMQDENEAAVKRFDQIAPDAPDNIRFALYYNSGIIAHRNGNFKGAAQLFKQALEIDSGNINAKINLELSMQEDVIQSRSKSSQMSPVTENQEEPSALESAIYSVLRENDQKQWKNRQQDSAESSALDY